MPGKIKSTEKILPEIAFEQEMKISILPTLANIQVPAPKRIGAKGVFSITMIYSTVTDLARFRGLSTSNPLATEM